MGETSYQKPISFAEYREMRIERIFVKHHGQEEIRFSWWPGGRFSTRPLDLPEHELLELMREAIKNGVLTPTFVDGLRNLVGGK